MRKIFICSVLSVLALSSMALATEYDIDSGHSSVNFSIKHLVVSKTRGKFDKFSGTFSYEKGKPGAWKTEATIEAKSINTNEPKRDTHLRSEDFFDVKKYPTITFKSGKVSDLKGDSFKMEGELTMHGVTKPVVLDVEMGGEATDPWGNKKAGFSAKTKINRKDFGLTWNKALETGGMVVGEDVEITLEIEGTAKSAVKSEGKKAK